MENSTSFPTSSDHADATVNDATRTANATIDRVSKAAHQAVDKASEAVMPAAEWLTDRSGKFKVTQQQLRDDTCAYIAENPLKSVGIALGVGFLLAKLMR